LSPSLGLDNWAWFWDLHAVVTPFFWWAQVGFFIPLDWAWVPCLFLSFSAFVRYVKRNRLWPLSGLVRWALKRGFFPFLVPENDCLFVVMRSEPNLRHISAFT